MSTPASDTTLKIEQLLPELTAVVIKAVNLDLSAADVDPDAPLYGDQLGLDSIDILEIALEVSKHYNVLLKAEDEGNDKIFTSMRSLARYVVEQNAAS